MEETELAAASLSAIAAQLDELALTLMALAKEPLTSPEPDLLMVEACADIEQMGAAASSS